MQTALTTAAATSVAIFRHGGRMFFTADGTWGSGTVTLTYCESATGTFLAIGTGVSLSANGTAEFEMPDGYVKAVLSGSTGATVNWNLARVPL